MCHSHFLRGAQRSSFITVKILFFANYYDTLQCKAWLVQKGVDLVCAKFSFLFAPFFLVFPVTKWDMMEKKMLHVYLWFPWEKCFRFPFISGIQRGVECTCAHRGIIDSLSLEISHQNATWLPGTWVNFVDTFDTWSHIFSTSPFSVSGMLVLYERVRNKHCCSEINY